MSIKVKLTKIIIKSTPKSLVKWVTNIVLKDVAVLRDYNFDLDARKIYSQIQLVGESEMIEVWFEDFAIVNDQGSYKFVIKQADSNRVWLDNLLSRIENKEWKIPVPPHMSSYVDFAAELINGKSLEQLPSDGS